MSLRRLFAFSSSFSLPSGAIAVDAEVSSPSEELALLPLAVGYQDIRAIASCSLPSNGVDGTFGVCCLTAEGDVHFVAVRELLGSQTGEVYYSRHISVCTKWSADAIVLRS